MLFWRNWHESNRFGRFCSCLFMQSTRPTPVQSSCPNRGKFIFWYSVKLSHSWKDNGHLQKSKTTSWASGLCMSLTSLVSKFHNTELMPQHCIQQAAMHNLHEIPQTTYAWNTHIKQLFCSFESFIELLVWETNPQGIFSCLNGCFAGCCWQPRRNPEAQL